MGKQILVFKGSPRVNGNSSTLADEAAAGARAAGAEVECFSLHLMDIRACDACDICHETGVCVLKDDMQTLYPKLEQADAIIIASPVYWFTMSAQTKLMIDRWYALRRGPLANTNIEAIIDRQSAEITPALAVAQGIASTVEWNNRLNAMKSWLVQRANWLDRQFDPPPVIGIPADAARLVISEIMFNPNTIRQLELINSKLSYLTHIIRQRDYEEMRKFLDSLRENIED